MLIRRGQARKKHRLEAAEFARSLTNEVLHLILMPTEACNFRCSYCYESFEHGRMAPEVAAGVKQLLTRRAPELSRLELSWFGGEPLLAHDVIENVMEHVVALRRQFGFDLAADMTTNGWFLQRPLFERLLDLGVRRYQVSMDGPQEWHDRTRRRADGRGTFETVWGNLCALKTVNERFDVWVRLHASAENRASLASFVAMCGQEFDGDARFRLLIKPLSALGGPHDADFPFLDEASVDSVVEELKQCAVANNIKLVDARDLQPICYASRANSFVVRADGRLAKCTVALDAPINQVGRLHEDGSVDLETDSMLAWMRGLWSKDAGELLCPKRGLVSEGPTPARSIQWRATNGQSTRSSAAQPTNLPRV